MALPERINEQRSEPGRTLLAWTDYCGAVFMPIGLSAQLHDICIHAVIKFMTSEERREKRYQRRKAERDMKKSIRSLSNTRFHDSFGFDALLASFKKCSKTNRWKTAVKIFGSQITVQCARLSKALRNGSYKSSRFRSFTILERGHIRHVQSLHISDMTVQGSFRDNCLHPLIRPFLIYDNGACLSGKGSSFALKRFARHLKKHIDKYGTSGYIYFFDFKSYFKNIDRGMLDAKIRKILIDDKMHEWFLRFTSIYCDEGLSLGSSISQICAVFYPNHVDHFIKDKLGITGYGRYMDDGYIICESLSKLKDVVSLFEQACCENGILLNKKKCRIVKLKSHYTFLKTRFFITDSGKIIRRPNKKSNVIERRKIKKFRRLMDDGSITFNDTLLYFHSWLCSRSSSVCYHSNLNMIKYFNSMFSGIGRYKPPKVNNRKTKVLLHLSTIA